MTLLEVVFAVVLLSLVVASVTGAMAFTNKMDARNDKRLGAYELANRLILQYLDDPKAMPRRGAPLDYGFYRYLWDVSTETVEMKVKEVRREEGRGSGPQMLDRFEEVTARVWIADEEPGQTSGYPRQGELLAELSRVHDPFFKQDADAADRLVNDPSNMEGLIRRIMRQNQGGGGGSSPRGGGGGGSPSTGGGGR